MSNTILVTYATRTGSTKGVAEAIGKTLSESGTLVDVLPMQDVKDIAPYDAVVVGSAIRAAAWLPEAMEFVRTHRAALARRPVAIFAVCMTLAMKKGDYRNQVSQWLAPVRALVNPVSEGLFAGILDISQVPTFSDRLKFRMSVMAGVWSEGDHRDWEAIRAWAAELPAKLQRSNAPDESPFTLR
ncbi:MAG: flavodoxin domain-containing protein [Anaerolineae bacterium]|nr:flavodoxin domain-containing protein [Anaerolineae bacterium]